MRHIPPKRYGHDGRVLLRCEQSPHKTGRSKATTACRNMTLSSHIYP
jgi:hypothetical protein